jgi:hypothetical protein
MMLLAFLLLRCGFAEEVPSLDSSLPWHRVSPAELPRLCVIARTFPSPRMRRLLPAFLLSLLGGGYPALDIFVLDTEFLAPAGAASAPALEAVAALAVAAAAPGSGAVRVARLSALDVDVADMVLGATGWATGAAGSNSRWARGWVATDVLLNRLLRCGGAWARPCAWDGAWETGGGGGGSSNDTVACDYYLITNVDNAYGAEFLPQVWARGVAPLWPGRGAFWRGAGAVGRRGRDVVGVHYVTYYTIDGGGSGGTEATRFLPRRVTLPLTPGGEGQSLDLGALLWSGPALRDASGGGFLARDLRAAVGAAVAEATAAIGVGGGGGGDAAAGANGVDALQQLPLRVGGGSGGGVVGSLCAAGVALACGEALAGPAGERALAQLLEARLAKIWPSMYARDHVMASQVHGGTVLPRRLLARARGGGGGGGAEEAAKALALAAAAAADGHAAPQPSPAQAEEDPVIILQGLLFLHQ